MPRIKGNKLGQKPRQRRNSQNKLAQKPRQITSQNKLAQKPRQMTAMDVFTIAQKKAIKNYKAYNKLVEKIEMYGQTVKPRSFPPVPPTAREIRRLKEKLQTIHEYEKILRRYQRSVERFVDTYRYPVDAPQSHNTIDQRTLNILKNRYEEWKKWRRNWVRKIPKENDVAVQNLIDFVKQIEDELDPSSERDKMFIYHCKQFYESLPQLFPEGKDLRAVRTRIRSYEKITKMWDELTDYVEQFIFWSKDEQIQLDAWQNIIRIITDKDDMYIPIIYPPMEDLVYE